MLSGFSHRCQQPKTLQQRYERHRWSTDANSVCNASYTVCAVQLRLCCHDLRTALAYAGTASSLQPPHACLRFSTSCHAPCCDAVIPSHPSCQPSSCSAREFRQMEGPVSGARDHFDCGSCSSQPPSCRILDLCTPLTFAPSINRPPAQCFIQQT